ncbi:MAG: hypothetical protein LBG84_09555 [Treponema sp.]|jgi:hypothetical protein|nr:hypothetical protein [Treponema sp.]
MYSADSIIAALKSNRDLAFEGIGALGCPPPPPGNCGERPAACEKGAKQSCKQPVTIFHRYQKLTILVFRFFVSPGSYAGFIRRDDSSLLRLVKHGYIRDAELKRA